MARTYKKKPGEKHGRPTKEMTRQKLQDVYDSIVTPKVFGEITEKMVNLALGGDRDLQKYIHDRGIGRPRDSLDITSGEEKLTMQLYLPEKKARNDN